MALAPSERILLLRTGAYCRAKGVEPKTMVLPKELVEDYKDEIRILWELLGTPASEIAAMLASPTINFRETLLVPDDCERGPVMGS